MQIGLEEKDTLPKLSSKKKQITDSDFQAKVKNLPKEIEEVVVTATKKDSKTTIYDSRS